jgi:hypothetical protein
VFSVICAIGGAPAGWGKWIVDDVFDVVDVHTCEASAGILITCGETHDDITDRT